MGEPSPANDPGKEIEQIIKSARALGVEMDEEEANYRELDRVGD